MKRALQVLNELQQSGIIAQFAVGGAMAAMFYTEPLITYDLDIFVVLPKTEAGLLALETIYKELRNRGYKEERECMIIEGVPVQFLPAYNNLVVEALRESRTATYEDQTTYVFLAEYLVAICLQAGRPKDKERTRLLREQANLDIERLTNILDRYDLLGKWKEWMQ
jgi:hypothetical protein